jgi:hypothetical protein
MMGHQTEPSRSGRSRCFSHTPAAFRAYALVISLSRANALMLFARALDAIFELAAVVR